MAKQLLLLFNLDNQRFAVRTNLITEIIPLVEIVKVPKSEPYICGLFNFRGTTIPIVDMTMLLYDKPHTRKVCTRILVLSINQGECITQVGLIAERVNSPQVFDTKDLTEHQYILLAN